MVLSKFNGIFLMKTRISILNLELTCLNEDLSPYPATVVHSISCFVAAEIQCRYR